MLRLDHIRDVDTMRQVAMLLERENDRLHAKLQTLTRELSQLRGEDASAAQRQLEALKEILAHREQALFGASSEKRPQPPATAPAPAAPPQRGHGPKAQPALPIIDMVHELAASDRTCASHAEGRGTKGFGSSRDPSALALQPEASATAVPKRVNFWQARRGHRGRR